MISLRHKLALGFGGLLAVIFVIGFQSVSQLSRLGVAIDVILRENYRSVIACQNMKESLERIDSGALFTLLGTEAEGKALIEENVKRFEEAVTVELNTITLQGEGEKAQHIADLFAQYREILARVTDNTRDNAARHDDYFQRLYPLFRQIKDSASDVLTMNQENMSVANMQARTQAADARQTMYVFLIAGTVLALAYINLASRWILRPITRLTESAQDIQKGNLELVVVAESKDELGKLSDAFNAMTASLREFRRADRANLVRSQRATQEAFKALPEVVAVTNPDGTVEVATDAAQRDFDMKPGAQLAELPYPWLQDLATAALERRQPVEAQNGNAVIQHFVEGVEHFYRPRAFPIVDAGGDATGVILALTDVTLLRQNDEMKRGAISTVSHQLKTPLTSLRMALHLLLDEKVGLLTGKQVELLVAARDDSDRLANIIDDLLNISRIQSGRSHMALRPVSPQDIVRTSVEAVQSHARDHGIEMRVSLPGDLPMVLADASRISHVFANLLSNALKYTGAGGRITVRGAVDDDYVSFAIEDSGRGIAPEHLRFVFDQFYRVPEQGPETGAGLGLAIVKEIVEAHGGAVSATSSPGKGSTFTFTLKRADI